VTILSKVRATILDNRLFSKGETIVVAVSGGPDSLALLHLLLEVAPELAIDLHIAHLDHKLRAEASKGDAAFVAEKALELGVPSTIEARDVARYSQEHHLSLEEAARVVRYKFLGRVCAQIGAQTIAVGHNADDQVETIVMHMLRGAGLAGLRGMTYKSPLPIDDSPEAYEGSLLRVVRPLLDVGRADVEAYCREKDLIPRFDASNLDTTMFRNRIRRQVIPYLEELNPNLRQVLMHSARSLADDFDFLRAATEASFSQVTLPERNAMAAENLQRVVFDREKWRSLPLSMQRATLREAVRRLRRGLRDINWTHIEDARRVAVDKGVGSEATLPQGLALIVGYDDFIVGETVSLPDIPLLHAEMVELRSGAALKLPGSLWQVWAEEGRAFTAIESEIESQETDGNRWSADFDADQVQGRLVLRTRRAGERFQPTGLGGRHKSLHEFMIEDKVPRHLRDLIPILADEEKILWVCGFRTDERSKVTDHTKQLLAVHFLKSDDLD
jgi:tRNA(Ile)-lysidine synthase